MATPDEKKCKAIVIGCSAGGIEALKKILPSLRPDFSIPILIVIHRGASISDNLTPIFKNYCALPAVEASDKQAIKPGTLYIAPGDYHLLVEHDKSLSLSVDERICFCRPSIDVTFETAAECYQGHLVSIILTGGNRDGSFGSAMVKKWGGTTIAQDPQTAQISIMPQEAIETQCIDHIMDIETIANFIANLDN